MFRSVPHSLHLGSLLMVSLLMACLFAATSHANQAPNQKLSPSLEQELDATTDPIRALVVFELPQPSPGQSPVDVENNRRQEIAEIAKNLRAEVGAGLGQPRSFVGVAALAANLNKATATALANRPDVKSIDIDPPLTTDLEVVIPLLGIDTMHAIEDPVGGIKGQGGKLAVIDSGITQGPDLQYSGSDLVEACFCVGCCAGGSDEAFGPGSAEDEFGHGTKVLGAAASQGVNAGVGPAPLAQAVVAKVVASDGSMFMSDIVAALDWVSSSHADTDVVNLSLGTETTFSGDCNGAATWVDVFEEAIDLVIANGTLVVASAGNGGVHTQMSAPACLSQVIAVGASYTKDYSGTFSYSACSDSDPVQDGLACFSNVSSTTDVMAPGAFVEVPTNSGGVEAEAGTSFSAPIVSGCLTQIMAAEPSASAAVLKASLSQSEVLVSTPSGSIPRLDCLAAYRSVRTIFYDSFEAD